MVMYFCDLPLAAPAEAKMSIVILRIQSDLIVVVKVYAEIEGMALTIMAVLIQLWDISSLSTNPRTSDRYAG